MVRVPRIRREALLAAVEFREPVDPPDSILKQFRIHDLLLFIGYLRQQGITFDNLGDMKKSMPRLYAKAEELINFERYFRREGGRRYNTDGHSPGVMHRPNLVVTRAVGLTRKDAYYQNNRAPDIVEIVRRLYSEGWSLTEDVMEREGRSLYHAVKAGLFETCDDVDFSHIPSVKVVLDKCREDRNCITAIAVRIDNNLSRTDAIKNIHAARYCAGFDVISFAALVSGIDGHVAEEESDDYRERILHCVKHYLDRREIIPLEITLELRKHFPGRYISLIADILSSYSKRDAYYDWPYHKEIFDLFVNIGFDFSDPNFKFEGIVDKEFALWGNRKLDDRCKEAFSILYRMARRGRGSVAEKEFEFSYRSPHNALIEKYKKWDRVLVTYYGLEGVEFSDLDPDIATVDARNIAGELTLSENEFYRFAKKIGLPLAERETVRYKFLHRENATVLLERVRERYRFYERASKG